MTRRALLVSGLAFISASVHAAQTPAGADLDAYVASVMAHWGAPAMAIAVVKDDEVVFAKGYGTREAGRLEPVDENTIFEIGSVTKSFTAGAAALLVDAGQLRWDDKVISHLPLIQFPDPWITAHATLEDLAAHRVGFDANILWAARAWNMDSVLERVRYLTPVSHFGTFFYSNTGVMALGKVVEKVSGQRWQDFYQSRLFAPLGMSRTSVEIQAYVLPEYLAPCWHCASPAGAKIGLAALEGRERNVAVPHGLTVAGNRSPGQGRAVEVWPWREDGSGPAGAVNSTARDLAQWMILHLNQGTYHGRQFLSVAQIRTMHAAHVAIPDQEQVDSTPYDQALVRIGYGYGWEVGRYRNHPIVSHGGGMAGFGAYVYLFPQERLGIVALQNLHFRDSAAQIVVARRFADHYLGLPPLDWNAFEVERWDRQRTKRELISLQQVESARLGKAAARRHLGNYSNPAMGDVAIAADRGSLVLEIGPSSKADIYLRDPLNGAAVFRGADRRQLSISFVAQGDRASSDFILGQSGELQPFIFQRVK